MTVRSIAAGQPIDAGRGKAVVWIRGGGSLAQLTACLEQVASHTPAGVPVVVSDPSVDPQQLEAAVSADRELLHQPGGDLLAATAPADVVLLDRGCRVAEGWFEGLRQAAYADSTVASASALSTAELDLDGPPSADRFESLAAGVRERSLRLRPRVDEGAVECVYVRRTALELAGRVDTDFWWRCVRSGLNHVIADDVLVHCPGRRAAAGFASAPQLRSLSAARRAAKGLSVVIDARIDQGQMTGTYVYVTELIAALARTGKASIRVVVDAHARDALDRLDGVEPIGEGQALAEPRDVVHRPFQVFGAREQSTLSRMADRVVITNHDLIGYRNPSYFDSPEAWRAFQRQTRHALALADHVVFDSEHARCDALAEDLVDGDRATVVHSGVDRGRRFAPVKPSDASDLLEDAELIVCLGADYRHKNRVFALQVTGHLQRDHDWPGYLVFAGPRMRDGGSATEEAELLARDDRLAGRTVELGAVTEEEKEWLLGHAAVVFYPTLYEGFGLVPFEAAQRGVPCMWAPVTSLVDLLGDEAPIVAWDPRATAARAFELLRVGAAAERNVSQIQAAGARLTWETAAEQLLALYALTCDLPPSPASALARANPAASVTEDGLRLVGPGGVLARDLERPLLALATHPAVGRPVLGGIRLGYRVSHAVRRLGARRV